MDTDFQTPEFAKNIRGEKAYKALAKTREAIDAYLHTYYESIRDNYLDKTGV